MSRVICLALETSCDETAASVVAWESGKFHVLSSIISSQAQKHAVFGGVVPELASREHLPAMHPLCRTALEEAGLGLDDLDVVAATRGPGLAVALLMGHSFAKALAVAAGKPFLGVNHIEGHLLSPFLAAQAPSLSEVGEWLALVVSGGHTMILRATPSLACQRLATTRDDAAGEAFDKGAKILGLGYPGGPALEKAARGGDAKSVDFPRGMLHSPELDFSFSGLKTALKIYLSRHPSDPADARYRDICASYQQAILDPLVSKFRRAVRETGIRLLAVAGGVACNRALRAELEKMAQEEGATLLLAPPEYCTDNAAMIGAVASLRFSLGERSVLTEDIFPQYA